MSEDFLEREVLGKVPMDRRAFVKKLALGAAFAVPAIASFDMLTSTTGYGVVRPNGRPGQDRICQNKMAQKDSLETRLANLPAKAPDRLRVRLQARIDNLDAYISSHCV